MITPGIEAGAFGQRLLDPGEAMPVGGDRAQHLGALALGGMQINAVEVVTGFLGADGEPRAVDQPAQRLRREAEPVRQRARRHGREILHRQHHEAGRVPARPQRQLGVAAGMIQFHLGAVGQPADDLIQRRGRRGAGAVAGRAGGHVLHDRDFHVGGGERQLALAHGDHDVGEDGDRIAPLHHALDMGQGLHQRGAVRLQFHRFLSFMPSARPGARGDSVAHCSNARRGAPSGV